MTNVRNENQETRRSIRLPEYDYAEAGGYFVTITVQDRRHLFGRVRSDGMALNPVGQMIEAWWMKLGRRFDRVNLDSFVVMPNHFHGTVLLDWRLSATAKDQPETVAVKSLAQVVQWFKTMTTNEYIRKARAGDWPPFQKRLWQRGYYERVIRNEDDLNGVRAYIANNPVKWVEKSSGRSAR